MHMKVGFLNVSGELEAAAALPDGTLSLTISMPGRGPVVVSFDVRESRLLAAAAKQLTESPPGDEPRSA